MSVPLKLLGFAAVALVVFAASWGVGRAVGPADSDAPVPTTAPMATTVPTTPAMPHGTQHPTGEGS